MTEIRRRAPAPAIDFASHLHPVLRRVYAARGIASALDLDLSLERLLPVSTLESVERAAEVLAAQRSGRVLVVGDFDADG
jgi:single-stranded-DNA-specific exonuclease